VRSTGRLAINLCGNICTYPRLKHRYSAIQIRESDLICKVTDSSYRCMETDRLIYTYWGVLGDLRRYGPTPYLPCDTDSQTCSGAARSLSVLSVLSQTPSVQGQPPAPAGSIVSNAEVCVKRVLHIFIFTVYVLMMLSRMLVMAGIIISTGRMCSNLCSMRTLRCVTPLSCMQCTGG